MKRNLILASVIVLVSAVLLFVFRKPARDLWFKVNPPHATRKVPSMIKSLPFKPEKRPARPKNLLLSKLRDDQLYLPDILFTPKEAPRGEYFKFSLVLQLDSKKKAKEWRGKKALLESLIINVGEKFSYADLRTPDGRQLFKKAVLKALREKYGPEIEDLWLTEYNFAKVERP
ncbi:MAG: flagellar basal body-associated FliL family protein [Thermodesulfobacteria bacterium]|nr:flagellar basal body-associated FliL family protein [Thermodesulfobacteriota bacterium]